MPETIRFDHYEVLTRDDGSLFELGRGAMGVTYKALDTNLRIPVCLKVIASAHLHSEVARQRFIREARSAARMRNPHVAAVYHLGAEGETYFYAMEFIDGETVDGLIKRNGPITPKLALAITDQVAKAFLAAEPHGLVHRDIKPANLMVIRDDDALAVKVIDFGLAKSSLPGDDSATLSMGGFVGTPHFASPEQLEERDLDVRSDIYSLAVTLWFMLAGKTPFAGSMAQVMSQHLSKSPPFEKLNVPPPLARLLRKMLEKDPANRPQNSAELRRDIAQCLIDLSAPDAGSAPLEPILNIDDAEQNFATIADPSMLGPEQTTFEVGSLIASRYRILAALGDTNLGQVFHAQDQSRAEDVRMIVLHPSLALNGDVLAALERTVEKLAGRPHANVVRIDALETIGGATFVVLEWAEGSSLVDVLRARRELRAEEVVPLLGSIGAGVDYALASGIEQLDPGLHHIQICFPSKPPEDWTRLPVGEWPPNAVKVNPLSFKAAVAAAGTWAGGQTVVDAPVASAGSTTARSIRAVAAIAYELLGGKLSHAALGGVGIEFKPLAALSEAGNEVLRRAFSPDPPFSSVRSFVAALAEPESADLRRHGSHATVGPMRTAVAPSTLPTATTTTSTDIPVEAPKKSKLPLVASIAVLLAAGGGFVAYKKSQPRPTVIGNPGTNTGTELIIDGGDSIADKNAAEAAAQSAAMAAKQEKLDGLVAAAKQYELAEDWPNCIATWVTVAKDFPEIATGRSNLEGILQLYLRVRPDGMKPEAFEAVKGPLMEAADMDIAAAMMVLAENYRRSDKAESFKWFDRAAMKGDPEGLTQAGLMLASGDGQDRNSSPDENVRKAVDYFKSAAERGHPSAQMALGELLLTGRGMVPKDAKTGVELLRKAVNGSNGFAMELLAQAYDKGIEGVLPENAVEAARLYELASQNGRVRALANLGALHMNERFAGASKVKGFNFFRAGAEKGDPICMLQLARCYQEGVGTAKNEQQKVAWEQAALAVYVKAAETNDDPNAMFQIGLFHERGQGTAKDEKAAWKWFEKAAAKNNKPASMRVFRRDAEKGDANSMFQLARLYEAGFARDDGGKEKIRWFKSAAEAGDPRAAEWCQKNGVTFKAP